MHVLVGAPWASGRDKPYLGAFLLSPERCVCYAKIHVTASEDEYFVAGEDRCVVSIKDVPTGIAICADTNYSAHAASAAEGGAEVYVASVMKTEAEYRDHASSMQRYAADHGMVTLTANHAGSTGGSFSAGRSAIWDERGSLIAQANSNQEALVVARRNNRKWHGEVVSGAG